MKLVSLSLFLGVVLSPTTASGTLTMFKMLGGIYAASNLNFADSTLQRASIGECSLKMIRLRLNENFLSISIPACATPKKNNGSI